MSKRLCLYRASVTIDVYVLSDPDDEWEGELAAEIGANDALSNEIDEWMSQHQVVPKRVGRVEDVSPLWLHRKPYGWHVGDETIAELAPVISWETT